MNLRVRYEWGKQEEQLTSNTRKNRNGGAGDGRSLSGRRWQVGGDQRAPGARPPATPPRAAPPQAAPPVDVSVLLRWRWQREGKGTVAAVSIRRLTAGGDGLQRGKGIDQE